MQRFRLTRKQSASNRTPRQINRSLVFNMVRARQPVSRADVARASGLQRSTVSLIVEDLIKDRWIIEGETGTLPRGRRPTYLQCNDRRAVLALDVHPLHTTIAIVALGGNILAQSTIMSPEQPNQAVSFLLREIRKMQTAHADKLLDGIGICLPGRPDLEHQKLIFAPNLRWPVVSLRSRIARVTGLRVEMDNVANACALGEVWFGDSDGMHDLVVVNVSEGIGTGIFANGQLLRGASGMAGEFGHVQIVEQGPLCGCGNHGCWETMASNEAALRYYREFSGRPGVVLFETLLKLAQTGDKDAMKALEKMSLYLGRGLRMIASALAPNEIVIVGDITSAWHMLGPLVEREMRGHPLGTGPKLRPAYEGNAARLRSAVALVMSEAAI